MAPKCKMREIGIMVIPVFLFFFMLFIAGALDVAAASTIVVNQTSPDYCDTIQEAVNKAKEGDTIVVCPGTYKENIEVNKSVSICSDSGASDTIVKAFDMSKSVFHITADHVNISGFTIKDGWEGIHLDNVSQCNISGNSVKFNYKRAIYSEFSYRNIIENNNILNNGEDGITLFLSYNNTIESNIILGNTYNGVFLDGSFSNIIRNNIISSTECGICLLTILTDDYIIPSFNNIINNNIISNTEYGIYLELSINNILKNNNISNNKGGIYLTYSLDNVLKNNTVSNNEVGISLDSSDDNTIEKNVASNNYGRSGSDGNIFGGIILDSSDNNTIKTNIANSNTEEGIGLYSSSNNNTIKENIASNNRYGIRISSSLNNTVKSNIGNSNKEDGISLYSSSNNTIEKNIVSDDGYGIYLASSPHNTIKNNIANSNSKYGIWLSSSDNNKIEKNIASNNYGGLGYSGIYLSLSFNNLIIENIANSNRMNGISLSSSCKNILENNNVSLNDCGISLSNSTGNNIYHNNIIGNLIIQAIDDNGNNWYNSTSLEGNYWDDYEGIDDGSGWGKHAISGDGIGDTKGSIPHHYDYYPFVSKRGWLTFLVSPDYWDFGTIYKGRSKNATFEIQNRGVHDLSILSIRSDSSIIISDIESSLKIPKDSPKTFNVTIDATNMKGDILRGIEIKSDDEITPNKTILIYGFVKPPIHDVRIESIDFDSRVIKGQIDVFNVSISNYGGFDEHNLSVEFKNGIEILNVSTIPVLLAGETETVSYHWDTRDAAPGVHEIAIEVRLPDKELLDSIKVKVNVLPTSEASTLIVTNFDRMSELWGENETAMLKDKLITLSFNPCVSGIIIRVEEDKNCADAYKLWKSDLLSPEEANNVSREIKQLIKSKLEEYRGIKYIILVGDDRVIPFYRIPDNSKESYVGNPNWWRIEEQYIGESKLYGNTTISAALQKNKYLTDDFYADFYPQDVPEGVELYIPDKPIGRLIETPEEISSTIDIFMEKESVYPNKIFIMGYDFMNDSSWSCAHILGKLKPSTMIVISSDIANYDNASDIVDEMLKKRNDVIAIFQHAEHFRFQIPHGKKEKYDYNLTSNKISNSPANLSGAIVYTMSCHAGLNVPPNETNSFDLAQSFMNKGVLAYVSPTGYGMGCKVSVAGHERLLNYFSEYLCKGNDVGTSLLLAKQDYYLHNFHFDYIDEKVISSIVLYGLPMYRVKTEAKAEAKALEEELQMDHGKKEQVEELEIATLTLRPGKIAKNYLLSSGKPILPKAAWPYTITEKEMIHGITLKSAGYKVEENVKVALGTFTVSTGTEENDTFVAKNWYPPRFLKVNTIGDKQEMVIISGQYRPSYEVDYRKGDLREFTELTFDIYISAPEKEKNPPKIAVRNESGEYIINVSDNKSGIDHESGIFKVIVAYTNITKDREEKRGEWKIREYEGDGDLSCNFTFKLDEGVEFFVQAVDMCGNVAVDDNDEEYYPEKPKKKETLPGSS